MPRPGGTRTKTAASVRPTGESRKHNGSDNHYCESAEVRECMGIEASPARFEAPGGSFMLCKLLETANGEACIREGILADCEPC